MLPHKVKVAGITYDVMEKDFIEIDDNRNYQGKCSFTNTNIEVLSSLSIGRKEDVFVHELLHAIFTEAGYDDQDEEMIIRVGKVLHQVLRDNKFEF
ncbi:ImmA/IrrE family metallo-endopeptidase [Radiobacillus sp. PE A8.2]|uniref:ImmA/IrrE family metallo-endopeptidase n=1 Tax=Radiobacillus sp. PE A8.2 TaxID=3380349 RepID=UPI00388F6BC7